MSSTRFFNESQFTTFLPNNATEANSIESYFRNLAKSWNISAKTLLIIVIIVGIIIAIFIVIVIQMWKKRKNAKKQFARANREPIFNLMDDFDKYESPYGYIDFTVIYNSKKKVLKIQNLMIGNISNIGDDIPDCYIRVFRKNKDDIKIQKKKTRTIEDSLCPSFPEVFSFKIDDLEKDIIYFQVFDENSNGNDYPMGDGELILSSLDQEKFVGFIYPTYVVLTKPSEILGCGEVCVILTLNRSKLNISILEAKNLVFKYAEKGGFSHLPSVYAVIKMFIKKNKKKTFKTKSVSNTRNPYFFETFIMNISVVEAELLVIKVEIHEFMAGKIPRRIGKACIGNKKFNPLINELGQEHLNLMIKNQRFPQAMWHALIKD